MGVHKYARVDACLGLILATRHAGKDGRVRAPLQLFSSEYIYVYSERCFFSLIIPLSVSRFGGGQVPVSYCPQRKKRIRRAILDPPLFCVL